MENIIKKLGNFVSVRNMNYNNHTAAPNQFIITFEKGTILQSYGTIVAGKLNDGTRFVTNAHDYSITTNRYVKRFLDMDINERRKAIETGELKFIEIDF